MLVLLHGAGADETSWDVPGALALRAPHPAARGFAWYADEPGGMSGFRESLAHLDAAVPDAGRVVVGGFSQGGAVALGWALTRPERVAGAWAVATSARQLGALGIDWPARAALPVLLCHGTDDPVVPVAKGRALRDLLSGHGLAVTYDEHPMGHEVCACCTAALGRWWASVRLAARPDGAGGLAHGPQLPWGL